MKTEEKLGRTLKELMATEPLDTITVKRLSALCGINRQTFYYHFRDLYDLLTWIFLNEQIRDVQNYKSWQEIFNAVLDYIENNYAFITNTLSSAGRELFKEFIFNENYSKTLRLLTYRDSNNLISLEDKKFVARFYTAGLSNCIIHWIDTGMKETRESFIRRVTIVFDDFYDNIINRFARK